MILTEGIDIFSKEGKERLEEEIDPTVNMVKANTLGPIKVNFYSSNNITVPEGGVHIDKLQSVGNQKFDEFLSKQNNESFINGYLREIDDFVKKNPFA